jgi:hypothetical protein
VRQGYCKFILQSSGGRCQVSRRERGSSLKDAEELGTLEVFKPSKVTEESVQNSARSAERVREQSKSRRGEVR